MSTGGIQNERGLKVHVGLAVERQTTRTDFGSVLGRGISKAADVALSATGLVAPAIPGGSVVAAAVNGLGSLKAGMAAGPGANTLSGNTTGLATTGTTTGGTSAYGGGGAVGGGSFGGAVGGAGGGNSIEGRAAGGSQQDQLMMATKQMQEMNQSFNLQYLQLQQQMQADNRQFTLLSNVMKTKHDTAKNAINNVR